MSSTGSVFEVFITFLKLGLTSFGGPIAHIGYYQKELIENKKWMTEQNFAQLVSISQFLPGPASSQISFTMGLLRAGWWGGIAAFLAFSLPSAILLFLLAILLPDLNSSTSHAVLHGLKLIALSVVAHAVVQMAKKLCPDRIHQLIAIITMMIVLSSSTPFIQAIAICIGALLGMTLKRESQLAVMTSFTLPYGVNTAVCLLLIFFTLLIGLPLFSPLQLSFISVMDAFYRAGALVFGGGHVVLPLLENTVVEPGWISANDYLAGYGAAQAVPGPVFAVSAYLGALLPEGFGGLSGAALALVSIFLPGFLLISAMLPLWHHMLKYHFAARAVSGVNAAVVGLLSAALYDPIWISVVKAPIDVIIAAIGFVFLQYAKLSAVLVCIWCITASVGVSLI